MSDPVRVLHLPASYLPWTVGGKEVYCHGLARALRSLGVDARVVLHQGRQGEEPPGDHEHEGVPVHVLGPGEGTGARTAVYGCRPRRSPGFAELLSRLRPDVVHLHDFSVAVNLNHLDAASAAGARIVMTYHSPGQSCLQRSLLFRGTTVCDGRILDRRCTACRLEVAGVPRPAASALAVIPDLGLDPDAGASPQRALTGRATTRLYRRAWEACIRRVDRFQVHADWAREVLRRVGVPAEKLVVVRSGLPGPIPAPAPIRSPGAPLRLAFVGRCEHPKGPDVLVDAVRRLPAAVPVRVSLYGPYWEGDYGRRLVERIRDDPRFDAPRILPPARVVAALSVVDACVVPSRCPETGPLVVMEAFAAGTPVIGSRRGGIAELVRDGVDGILYPAGDATALADILADLARRPERLAGLRRGVRPPRVMAAVAAEQLALYRELLAPRSVPAVALSAARPG